MSVHTVRFVLNDAPVEVTVNADRLLVDVLRADLGLTGTKLACGVGVCGACSVLVDGELSSACLLLAVFVDGRVVETVEGLAGEATGLTALQSAFLDRGGVQCGACTPGQLMAATALLRAEPAPTPELVRSWLAGNLCRCTGYHKIAESVLAAAEAARC